MQESPFDPDFCRRMHGQTAAGRSLKARVPPRRAWFIRIRERACTASIDGKRQFKLLLQALINGMHGLYVLESSPPANRKSSIPCFNRRVQEIWFAVTIV